MDQYADSVAVVQYHVYDEYQTAFGVDRAEVFYEFLPGGVPWLCYDGMGRIWPIEEYGKSLFEAMNEPTDMTISIGGDDLGGGDFLVTTRLCAEEDASIYMVEVYLVAVQDHYPSDPDFARNTFRDGVLPTGMRIDPGTCEELEHMVSMKEGWIPEDIRLITWAQEAAETYPAPVYQAAKTAFPFPPLPKRGDYDNDGDLDLDDLAAFDECFTGPDYVLEPPSLCLEAFDADGDLDLDLRDFAAVQAAVTAE